MVVSFSDLAGIKNFIAVLVKHGLEHNTMESKDFVYINLYLGNFWTVDWLDREWYHCWTKDSLPTHTNLYKSAFKKHVILDEVDENCVWWNNLKDPWKTEKANRNSPEFHNSKLINDSHVPSAKQLPKRLHSISDNSAAL